MVHYNDLKTTLENEMRRIATFLDAADGEETWPTLVDAAGFKFMHANGATLLSRANLGWDKGADRFLHEGAMGRLARGSNAGGDCAIRSARPA